MAAPIRFLSGRQQQQKIGIEGSTDNQKVLEVVGQVGIGTTVFEPSVQLEVRGDASVSGVLTTGSLNVTGSSSVPATLTVESLNATGVSTFGGAVDVNAGLDVDGQSDLDELVVAGVATFSNAVDINSTLDVDGDTQLDDLNVAGVSTFSSAVNATAAVNATDIIKGYKYTAVPYGSTVTLAVTVASKDSTHRYNGTGSGNGYVIDGIQAPFLTLTPGRTYRFTNDNTGSHPLKFYLEADKTTLYETNVNFQDAYTEITVTDETPIVLHYQCTAHGYMGNAVQTNANVVNTNYPATIRSTLDVTGVSTFPQLDVSTGGLDVDGLTNLDEVIVAGVSTFTGNIVAVSAEFSGNVTIAGTLTAEDKTNIDSLGIVTARTGVRVDAGGLIVTAGVSTFTDSVDINNGVGVVGGLTADSLTISGVTTGINAAGISSFVRIDVDGQADLDEVVIAGVATFQGAVNFDVNSEINIGTGVTILGNNLHVTGIVSAAQFIGDGSGITNLPGISTLGSSNLTDVNVSGTTTTVQLRISGIGTAEKFFVSTGGLEVDGQSDLDELVVAGVSTFSANTFINADLSVTGDIGASGIITATGINLVAGSGLDVGAVGVLTALSVDVSTGGIDVDGQATLDEVVVAGVATFSALADVNNRLDVAGGANIDQLNVAGIASFTQLDVSTGGIDVDGQATLDELVVAGVSTFTGTVKIDGALDIGVAGVDVEGLTNLDELIVAGVSTFSSTINGNVTGNLTGTASNASGATGDFSIADKIVHTGDTNTALRFPAADTFTVETGGSEAARFDSSQRLLLGNTSPRSNAPGADVGFQIEGASGGPTNKRFTQHIFGSGDGSGPYLGLAKHRGTSVGGNTIVVNGDELGGIYFQGADGTNFKQGASILGFVDGTPGSNDMPGRLIFSTTADGASSTTERLRIDSSGRLLIGSTQNVGGDQLQVNNAGGSNLGISRFADNTGGPDLFLIKSRDTTPGDHTTVADGDVIGQIRFRADDGSDYVEGCRIFAKVNGTVGTNSIPTDLIFGSGTSGTERLRITSAGNVNFLGSLVNVNATGVSSFVQLDVSTGGLDVDGQTDLDELQVAGVSTFSAKAVFNTAYPSIDADNEIQVGTAIQLGKAGVITATSFSGSGANLTGIAATDHVSTFDLVVAGVSTFVGVVTTLSDTFLGGKLNILDSDDGGKLNIGASNDLQIYHTNSGSSTIDHRNANNSFFIKGATIDFRTSILQHRMLDMTQNGPVNLYYANSKKLETTSTGVVATGILTATSFSGDGSALTGIGTQGIDVQAQSLTVAGISTFSGLTTVTSTEHALHTKQLSVSGVSTFIGNARFETLSGSGCIVTNSSSGSGGILEDSANHTINGQTLNTVNIVAQGNITVADKLIHGSDDNTTIRFPANDTIAAETAGVERLRINSVGDIQIAGIVTATGLALVAGSGLDAGATGIVTAVGAEFNGTSHIKLPAGSTGQRPGSPTAGDLRYNSDDGAFEGYTDSWGAIGGGIAEVDTNVSSTSAVGVGSFATASFRSAEVVAQIVQIDEYQVGKYLMIHDGTTVTVIEQAAVSTGDSMIGSFDGAINGSNAELRVTMVSSGIATVTTKISTVTV